MTIISVSLPIQIPASMHQLVRQKSGMLHPHILLSDEPGRLVIGDETLSLNCMWIKG